MSQSLSCYRFLCAPGPTISSVIPVTVMGTTLIISAWKMLCLCVLVRSVCLCVCACVRVIKVKCWCLVNRTASLECIYTHTHTLTVWPAVIEMCSVSSWIDPEDCNTTAASNSTFSSVSLGVPPPHLDLCPLSLPSFTFRGSWRAVCQRSSINWVPNWPLLLAVLFLDPFNRYSKWFSSNWCHVWLLREKSCQKNC